MKFNFKRELAWFVGILILTPLIGYAMLGEQLFSEHPLEIHANDTLLVVPQIQVLIVLFGVLFVVSKVVRVMYMKPANSKANIVFVFIAAAVLIALLVNWFSHMEQSAKFSQAAVNQTYLANRLPVLLVQHWVFTLSVGIVTLVLMIFGYKLVLNRPNKA